MQALEAPRPGRWTPLLPMRRGQLLLHQSLGGPREQAIGAIAVLVPGVGFFAMRKAAPSLNVFTAEGLMLRVVEEACDAASQLATALATQ